MARLKAGQLLPVASASLTMLGLSKSGDGVLGLRTACPS